MGQMSQALNLPLVAIFDLDHESNLEDFRRVAARVGAALPLRFPLPFRFRPG